MRSRHSHPVDRKRLVFRIVCILLAAVLAFAALYTLGRRLELSSFQDTQPRGELSERFPDEPTISYGSKEYAKKRNLTTILFMGVDKSSAAQEGSAANFRNGGQADYLLLMVIDPQDKTVTQLHIDRDTMTEITVLGVLGNVAGTRRAQVCLSHGFGDGQVQSCMFTVEAVQRLLYGIDIDFYIAMNLDGIPVANDAIGGVEVLIEDDFTALDATMKKGEVVRLVGDQAELYVRSRMSVGDGTNSARMKRQQTYMSALMEKLSRDMAKNPNIAGDIFDALDGYLISNMKRGRMINEANKAIGYAKQPVVGVPGEHIVGTEGFVEYIADEKALEALVIDIFYREV